MADVKVTRRAYNAETARQDQQESLDRNIPAPWRTGKLITGITMVPGTNRRVSHGLGRKHSGWVMVRPRETNGAHVFESQVNEKTTITLSATGAITFDLWVW